MPRRNRRPPAPEPFGMTSLPKPQTQAQPERVRHPRRGPATWGTGGGRSDLRKPPVGEVPGTPTALPGGAADFGGYSSPAFRGARQ